MTSMGTVYDLERNRALGLDTESLLAKNAKLRALHLGKRGGFKTMAEAKDAVEKITKFGTVNV